MTVRKLSLLSLASTAWLMLAVPVVLTGCTQQTAEEGSVAETPMEGVTMPVDTTAQEETLPADHILVQHVLIGFQGSVPGKNIARSQAEAEALANEILQKARAGEDFDAMVKQYTDDAYPGIYGLANSGITPGANEFSRDGMVKGFSDVSFSLQTGEVGIASYSQQTSPYGWHIIKRVD